MYGTVCIGDAINWGHSLNRGLVSRWKALPDQQRGVMFRDLCMRNHGTLTSGPLWAGPSGRVGGSGSLFFDGSNDYVDLGSVLPEIGQVFTFCAWVKVTSTGAYCIFGSNNATGAVHLRISSNAVQLHTDGAVYTSGGSVSSNVWTHVAATRATSNGYANIYVNGISKSKTTDLNINYVNSAGAKYIGRRAAASNLYSGLLDDVQYHNIALTDGEVAALYQASRSEYDPTLNWSPSLRGYEINTGGAVTFGGIIGGGVGWGEYIIGA